MISFELESGSDKYETTNSYFSYIEERQNREADHLETLRITSQTGTIVVGQLEAIRAGQLKN